MAARHQLRTYYYGNFATTEALNDERLRRSPPARRRRPSGAPSTTGRDSATTTSACATGLPILSEAYSYLDFAGRVDAPPRRSSRRSCGSSRPTAGRSARCSREADADPLPSEAGVTFELARSLPDVDILVGAVEKKVNPRSGREMTAMVETRAVPTRMRDYGTFVARRQQTRAARGTS